MATQIIPDHSFPYVQTVINDNTYVSDATPVQIGELDDTVRYIFPFVAPKGIDNTLVKFDNISDFVDTYGNSNYKKYGQPLMMPINLLTRGNCEVWCMRVMPDDAKYANKIVRAYYKADDADAIVEGYEESSDDDALTVVAADAEVGENEISIADVDYAFAVGATVKKGQVKASASQRSFHIGLVSDSVADLTDSDSLVAKLKEKPTGLTGGKTTESFELGAGYSYIPLMSLRSSGRGVYGNNLRVRITQNTNYEKTYGIKFNNYEIMTTENGLSKLSTYIGANCTSSKYSEALWINDLMLNAATGTAPVDVYIDEDSLEVMYDAYVEFVESLLDELNEEYETKAANGADDDTLAALQDKIDAVSGDVVDLDEFDPFFGREVNGSDAIPFVKIEDTSDAIDDVDGLALENGDDGAFSNLVNYSDIEDAANTCYENCFNGTYDKRILSARRVAATALFDANYSYNVKCVMADLAVLRNDGPCYLDTGIIENLTSQVLNNLIEKYSVFNDYKISKNLHHYEIRESTTNKRVKVTITYFLAQKLCSHINNEGTHIPMVKLRCQLTGHVKNSLSPAIEDTEVDLKDTLYENRFNYFETVEDNVFQRATQSTSQMGTSDLLEESNVLTLFQMKRIVENYLQQNLYNFSDATVRSNFVRYFNAYFADWIGRKVESFSIEFKMSEWEFDHSVLHAYLAVTFRGIFKRVIVEIDINKRTYDEGEEEE